MQNNPAFWYGLVGLLAGILLGIGVATYSVNTNQSKMMQMMGMNSAQHSTMMQDHMTDSASPTDMSMDDMMTDIENVSGAERDEQFLRIMIVHHQGAIAMAERIQETTERPELLTMADDVISVQSKEIDQMRQWLKDWFNKDVGLEVPAGLSQAGHVAHHTSN